MDERPPIIPYSIPPRKISYWSYHAFYDYSFKYFLGGVILTFPALVLAMLSAGAGHGDYIFAKLLFPAPILLMKFFQEFELVPLCLALVQFPIYGLITAYWAAGGRRKAGLIGLLSVHSLLATVCMFA